jgi:hypothetical protein
MKATAFLFGALLCGAPAAAQPSDSVRLAPGDAAVVHIDAGVVAANVQHGGARWTPLDIAAARHMAGQAPIGAPATMPSPLPGGQMPLPPPIAAGEIRMRMHDVAGQHTILIIENGYGRALVFHAQMARGDRSRATDVCLVVPNNRSFEHWPEPLDSLELSQLVQVDWREGDPVPCR